MSLFPIISPAAAKPVTFNFLETDFEAPAQKNAFTFVGNNIGAAAGNKQVLVAYGYNGNYPLSSVTVDGETCANLVTEGDNHRALLSLAEVSGGSTGDIVVTIGAPGAESHIIGLWEVFDAAIEVASDTGSSDTLSGNVLSVDVNCPANGAVFACCCDGTSSGFSTMAWTGITEEFEQNSSQNYINMGGGAILVPAGDSTFTVTVTTSGETNQDPAMSVIALAPV